MIAVIAVNAVMLTVIAVTQVWGNDREMMTTDCCGGVYYGRVQPQPAASLRTVALATPMISPQPGGALCVLNGTNAGDCRRLAKGDADSLSSVTLDKPFTAPLDASSIITIVP